MHTWGYIPVVRTLARDERLRILCAALQSPHWAQRIASITRCIQDLPRRQEKPRQLIRNSCVLLAQLFHDREGYPSI